MALKTELILTEWLKRRHNDWLRGPFQGFSTLKLLECHLQTSGDADLCVQKLKSALEDAEEKVQVGLKGDSCCR